MAILPQIMGTKIILVCYNKTAPKLLVLWNLIFSTWGPACLYYSLKRSGWSVIWQSHWHSFISTYISVCTSTTTVHQSHMWPGTTRGNYYTALLCSGGILCLSRFLQVWFPVQYTPVSSHCNQNKLKIICKRLFISSISDTGWYECYSTSYRKSLDIWLGSNIKWFNSVHPLENTVKIRKTLLLKWEIVSQDKCRKPFHLAV